MRYLVIISFVFIFPNMVFAGNCLELLKDIRTIPQKNEAVEDYAYNRLMEGRYANLECLVDEVLNTTTTVDPRKSIPLREVKIGDVALFVITDIVGTIDIRSMLSDEYKVKWDKVGVYAYFEYVENYRNRESFQLRLKEKLHNRGLLSSK